MLLTAAGTGLIASAPSASELHE